MTVMCSKHFFQRPLKDDTIGSIHYQDLRILHYYGNNDLFGELNDGYLPAVVEIATVALKQMLFYPEIGIVKNFQAKYPFSFRSELDFDFLEIFHTV